MVSISFPPVIQLWYQTPPEFFSWSNLYFKTHAALVLQSMPLKGLFLKIILAYI